MDIEVLKAKYNYSLATQVMQQYLDVKFANYDCLVLFRMGDFYELFYEDAITAARILGVALTKRGKSGTDEIPMCGVPFHALENYLNKLLEEGFKVAICDQMETPEDAKKRAGYKAVVRREVTRIITPGTLIEDSLLDSVKPNYLASVVISYSGSGSSNAESSALSKCAICYLDLSTSKFFVISLRFDQLINELARIKPSEVLISERFRSKNLSMEIEMLLGIRLSFQVDSFFADRKCSKIIENYYKIPAPSAIGELDTFQISAIGSIIEYVCLTQKANLPKLPFPKLLTTGNFMLIDSGTRRNLELVSSVKGGTKGSLFATINHTLTKGGARLLHEYLSTPLIKIEQINTRLEVTEFLYQNPDLVNKIRKVLAKTADMERAITRIQMQRGSPRDLLSIRDVILIAEQISAYFLTSNNNTANSEHDQENSNGNIISRSTDNKNIDKLIAPLIGNFAVASLISEAIREDAPNNITDGGIININYHPKIKELQELMNNSRLFIDKLRDKYRTETGIDNLKISNNNVIGLFIEVTSRNSSRMTDPKFIHRQSTASSIRYTTSELQELESKMISSRMCLSGLEKEVYEDICRQVTSHSARLHQLATAINRIDVFTNFAFTATEFEYCKPTVTETYDFAIVGGRHPVVEKFLKADNESFISNDCYLNHEERIWLITGPNMAGKSTFLRQNAIIAILAHIGSFVPAVSAQIGVIDKIFSRVGAGDDLTRGQSTFMVEMLETSAILSQSTDRSLVILDEVGRGTSTHDGVAIAWSVLEHIHNELGNRCLFATHYHELTNLSKTLPGLKNYTVAISEDPDTKSLLFLHKIIKGFADRSYGVYVAESAGLPASVIKRATELLARFEQKNNLLLA